MRDGGKFSPGNSPGTATINGAYTLGAAGEMEFEIFNALGTAGATTGWDLVRLLGPDGILDRSIYDWLIVDTAQGITGLDPGDIGIDAASFANPLNGGTFSVAERSGDLYLHFQPVPEPTTLALFASCVGLLGLTRRRSY